MKIVDKIGIFHFPSGGDKFVSVADDSNKAAYSTSGTGSWSASTLPSSDNWLSVCYGGGKFVSVAQYSNQAAYSTSGTGSWSASTLPSSDYWYSVCYGGGKFVSVAYNSNQATIKLPRVTHYYK